MTKHRTRLILPTEPGPLRGINRRNEQFDKQWSRFCETCRSLASDRYDYTVTLDLPTPYRLLAAALDPNRFGVNLYGVPAVIEGVGQPKAKAPRRAPVLRTVKPQLETIRRQAAADHDPDNREYWLEMIRLASGDDEEEAIAA